MDHTHEEHELLTYTEAAALFNLPTATLYSWVSQRRVPHVRLGPRTVRFAREELKRFVDENRVAVRR